MGSPEAWQKRRLRNINAILRHNNNHKHETQQPCSSLADILDIKSEEKIRNMLSHAHAEPSSSKVRIKYTFIHQSCAIIVVQALEQRRQMLLQVTNAQTARNDTRLFDGCRIKSS